MGVLDLDRQRSVEASGGGDYYWESDFEYLFSFHSLVVGKVAVLLVAVVKVVTGLKMSTVKFTSTSNAVVKVAKLLMVVGLVTWFVEAWERRCCQARPIALTAGYRV